MYCETLCQILGRVCSLLGHQESRTMPQDHAELCSQKIRKNAEVLRCGKVILVFGLYEDVGQANVATALEPKQAAAR
jgi:hypothetical protein